MSKMSKTAFIFDLDGVIVDSAKYHFLAWKKIAEEFGHNLTEDENDQLKGISRIESLNMILAMANKEASQEQKEDWLLRKNEIYLDYIQYLNKNDLLFGVVEFMTKLKQLNIPMAIGSASKNARTILKALDITDAFDVIVDGTNVTKSKPDPEVFLLGCESLNVFRKNCVVIEDSAAGIQAAQYAGMKTIGIGQPSVLGKADVVVNNLNEITQDIFEQLIQNN